MGEVAATTFLDEILLRHQAFRAVEDAGADLIRREFMGVRDRMLQRAVASSASITKEGHYLTTAAARRRAQGIVDELDTILKQGISSTDASLLALKEGAFQTGIRDFEISSEFIPEELPESLASSFDQLFPEAAGAALTNPTLGIRPSQAWNGVEAATTEKVQKIFVGAVASGEAVTETAAKLADALDVSVTDAERIARTNLNAMYNDAQLRVINRNPDIFAGSRWVAALDDRTSAICIRLHGSFWPIGSTPPGPPAHWNCRSILQGVFKNQEIQAQQLNDRQRVKHYAADGTFKEVFVKTKTPPSNWLQRQPMWVKRQVLGSRTKAELFTAGKATIEDIVSPAMLVRTDKQLLRRLAAFNPSDSALRALAREAGVYRVPSRKLIEAEDRALASRQFFNQPTPMPDPNVAPGIEATQAAPQPKKSKPTDPLPEDVVSNEQLVDDWRKIEIEREAYAEQITEDRIRIVRLKADIVRFPKQGQALVPQLKSAERRLAESRKLAGALKSKADEAWAKIEAAIPPELQPARLPDNWLPLKLHRAEMTRAEFSAVEAELTRLVAARDAAIQNPVSFVPPVTGKVKATEMVAQQAERYRYMMNQSLIKRSDDMARASLVEHRAAVEMGDLISQVRQLTLEDGQKLFKQRVIEINASTKYAAQKEEILNKLRRDIKRRKMEASLKAEVIGDLDETLQMMNDVLFEQTDSELLSKIKWKSSRKDRAWATLGHGASNKIETGNVFTSDRWMHEFGHHAEYRSNSGRTSEGWRNLMAWRKGRRYGGTHGGKKEEGYLGVFFRDYVGRDYDDGATEVVTMGHQSLFAKRGHWGKQEEFWFGILREPEHLRYLWGFYRGMAIW